MGEVSYIYGIRIGDLGEPYGIRLMILSISPPPRESLTILTPPLQIDEGVLVKSNRARCYVCI